MDSSSTIRDAHAWMRWLTARTVEASATLPDADLRRTFPIGLGSVWETLVHLYGAESVWIAAIEGAPISGFPGAGDFAGLPQLNDAWGEVRARWDSYLLRLSDAELGRVVVRVREGKEFRQRVADALMQVPTHALYHNAQLSFMFRSMGHVLPDSSWILYARHRLAAGQS